MQNDNLTISRSVDQDRILSLISKLFLLMNIAVYDAFAIGFFLIPLKLASWIGIEIQTTAALADFRAMYGGLCFGIGIVLVLALFRKEWLSSGILLSVTTAGGLLLGRLYTILLDGPGNEYIYISMATEVGAIVIGGWLLKRS
ncbi:DUF4345 domain-containing protein [Leptospira stimsonii]|uniref:DUF4345 domain-containing protein n=1 Tax=Leptospira stimsonii TaxID=2202203 RepID=A0ABY2N100_9LEPT|nr:DUF4345 domain-containing protein [Leptospira stimsonii]TGK19697.1 DUF4345 domain-containing protein [Leptospira stimsonii]TGM13696.1 DUF4345 domain-containing protein [Leptospira stimsonii]